MNEDEGFYDNIEKHLRPHDVYRVFDTQGDLLYIGMARFAENRINMHLTFSANNAVSNHIYSHYGSHTVEEFPTLAAAHEAEKKAIFDEMPLLNRQHNSRRFVKRNQKYEEVTA